MILACTVVYATLFIAFVLVFVPARIVEWSNLTRPEQLGVYQYAGASLVVVGGALALWCVLTFAWLGKGTPAPFDPPLRLVVRGPYRFVRNPMYIGAGIAIIGASLFYRSWPLVGYSAMLALSSHIFVISYEEPTLKKTFGADYDEYRRRVRRWLPFPSSLTPSTTFSARSNVVNSFIADLRTVLLRDLGAFRHEIELFPDDATVWRTMPGIGNSAGNLALHACGNLKLYIGGVLGKSGYVRNRDAEFSERGRSRTDLMREITSTMEVVAATLERFTGDRLDEPYPAAPNNYVIPSGRFLMHLAVHLTYHLGQVDYLRRALTGSAESGGGVGLPALVS